MRMLGKRRQSQLYFINVYKKKWRKVPAYKKKNVKKNKPLNDLTAPEHSDALPR
jgi:hypothetical protein